MRKKQGLKGLIFVISGPSGSGKTTLLKELFKDRELKAGFVKSVSLTTRSKRVSEREGKDYFFISEEEFQGKLRNKKIIERTRYLGYYYATPKDFLEKQLGRGKHIILCLDLIGAFKIKKVYPRNSTSIFIMPPSLAELRERIERRCCGTRREEILRRLALAQDEIAAAPRFDYYLVNRDLKETVARLKRIVLNKTKIGR